MARYIQFPTDDTDGTTILLEVDDEEVSTNEDGLVKVGIKDMVKDTIAVAQSTFSSAIKSAIRHNVQGLMEAVRSLPDPPTEVEITFGLKATGEVGNVAVVKGNGETNYTVKLVWKPTSNNQPSK